MPTIIRQNPTIKKAAYSPIVQFSDELVMVEHMLVTNDTLVPDLTSPLLEGSRVIYKLISDGVHTPSFSPLFIPIAGSLEFNTAIGAINLIEFTYKLGEFSYTISAYTTVDKRPYAIGDYGLGPNVLYLTLRSDVNTNCYRDLNIYPAPLHVGQITAFDMITSIHYLGSKALLYTITHLAPGGDSVTSSDPKKATVAFTGNDLGPQSIEIQITDGTLTSEPVQATVYLFDPFQS